MILVRRPYDIGDRIAVSDVEKDTSMTGSATWFVRDVTLVRIAHRFRYWSFCRVG
jgi:hypothetical protein